MAKPSPLPLGRANPHVGQSRGAESYIMNFYVTNYSTSFVKPNTEIDKRRFHELPAYTGGSVFKPRSAPAHHHSGFTSNERPQIYYRRTLDNLDNPEMGRILEDNYNTVTHLHYQPYDINDGLEDLPVQVLGQKSAYVHNNTQVPLNKQTQDLYIDTRARVPFDELPKHRAKLDQINDHNPITNENYGYGPGYMSTEYKTRYEKPRLADRRGASNPAVGPKEYSGFVANNEKDTLTGEPGERWLFPSRTTGVSDYKDRFLPFEYPRSDTHLPNLMSADLTKQSIYSRTFKPSNINPKGTIPSDTEYRDRYLGKQELDPRAAQQLGTAVIGPKEMGGQARCESGKVQQQDDPRRFITNYQMRHFDMNPKGKDREGYVVGGLQNQQPDGFTRSTTIHQADAINPHADLVAMESYQSRSIRARDTFYDDQSHDHKFRVIN